MYRFWYPTFPVEHQTFLPGMSGNVSTHLEARINACGHIMEWGGDLLCKQNKRKLKEKAGTTTYKVIDKPLGGIPICKKCMKKYSESWKSDNKKFENWINGVPL